MNNEIIVLIGAPLTGKTTWSKEYMKNNKKVFYVSRDAERKSILGSYRMGTQKQENVITEILFNKIHNLLKLGSVIIDNTHLRQKYIDEIVEEFSDKASIKFHMTDLPEDMDTLIVRNNERYHKTGKLIPANAIKKYYDLHKEFTKPRDIIKSEGKVDPRISNMIPYDSNLPGAIICDLDGTLALMNGRSPYEAEKCSTDVLNKKVDDIISIYTDLPIPVKLFFFTGRMATPEAREATEKWLKDNCGVYHEQYTLVMRKNKDFRSDDIVKLEMYNKYIKGKYNVEFVLDDRDQVVKMWRKLGLTCFQVYDGNF